MDSSRLFFVDKVQAQGGKQRRIPVPQKFWEEFAVGTAVRIELIKKESNMVGRDNDALEKLYLAKKKIEIRLKDLKYKKAELQLFWRTPKLGINLSAPI